MGSPPKKARLARKDRSIERSFLLREVILKTMFSRIAAFTYNSRDGRISVACITVCDQWLYCGDWVLAADYVFVQVYNSTCQFFTSRLVTLDLHDVDYVFVRIADQR